MRREKRVKSDQKRVDFLLKSAQNPISLSTNQGKIGDTFLGYKTKNINQLWDWRTLEDVVFK